LQRLRQALYLRIRQELPSLAAAEQVQALEDYAGARDGTGRLHLGRKDPRFWPVVGVVLDVLLATQARMSEAAQLLGITTGNLVDFLAVEPKVWEEANHLRQRFGHKPLRGD
jgi:hypothetical protein